MLGVGAGAHGGVCGLADGRLALDVQQAGGAAQAHVHSPCTHTHTTKKHSMLNTEH